MQRAPLPPAVWRASRIRRASERPGGGAILARHGLVCRQILSFCDDDDALDVLRRELALGTADHRGVHRHHGRSVHGDRDAQGQQMNSLFHGNLPVIDAYTLRAAIRPGNGHATKRPIARTKRLLGRRTIAMIAESRYAAYPVLAMSAAAMKHQRSSASPRPRSSCATAASRAIRATLG